MVWLECGADAARLVAGQQVEEEPAQEREGAGGPDPGGLGRHAGLGIAELVEPVLDGPPGEVLPGAGLIAQGSGVSLEEQPGDGPLRRRA